MENQEKIKNEFIKKWVQSALKKTKNINFNALSSYGLKHICEDSIGVYVSNREMTNVLTDLGFEKKTKNGVNYHFNISIRVKRVEFNNKLGNQYNNENRHFNLKTKTVEI